MAERMAVPESIYALYRRFSASEYMDFDSIVSSN